MFVDSLTASHALMDTLIIPFDEVSRSAEHEEDERGYVEAWARKSGQVYCLRRVRPSTVSQHGRVSDSIEMLLRGEYDLVDLN